MQESREGLRIILVGDSVAVRFEDGQPGCDAEEMPTITFSPVAALKAATVLVRYAFRAAAFNRRRHRMGVCSE
jgi:hypothetical protein